MRIPAAVRVAWWMLAIFAIGTVLLVAVAVANDSFARDPGVVGVLLAFAAFMVGASSWLAVLAIPSGGCSRPSACWQRPLPWPASMPCTPM